MGYTINSAKDSRGDEQLYMELFNRMAPQIQAYKKQRGGDLEGAFKAVTGTPWPEGRSVKMSHGAPTMTKDRTVKSVLGKYVAIPAAVAATAAFAPGALPTLGKLALHGGVKALAGRAALGAAPGILTRNWKGALLGAGIGAVSGGFGGGAAKGATQAGGSVMKDMITRAGLGAVQGGMQDGWKGAATGAAGGATQGIPGNAGRILNATGQSRVGGDIMAGIMNRGANRDIKVNQDVFTPGQTLQPKPVRSDSLGSRPQGW